MLNNFYRQHFRLEERIGRGEERLALCFVLRIHFGSSFRCGVVLD